MKIIKPTKLPILHRVVEIRRRPHFHVAGILSFPLASPRALCDELTFWQTTSAALGERGVFDEGFAKARGEILVCGNFFAPGGKPLTASFVRARVGSIDKRLAVAGDRFWQNQVPSAPLPFTTMPLDWARAFGGPAEPRNPYGKGAAPLPAQAPAKPVYPLPNIETFGQMMRSPNERPAPAGFLPMDVTFAQRRARAGTFDKRYLDEHFPGMPADMDPAFFNVAPEDQWAPGFFRGDEDFLLENMHPEQASIWPRCSGGRHRTRASRGKRPSFRKIKHFLRRRPHHSLHRRRPRRPLQRRPPPSEQLSSKRGAARTPRRSSLGRSLSTMRASKGPISPGSTSPAARSSAAISGARGSAAPGSATRT